MRSQASHFAFLLSFIVCSIPASAQSAVYQKVVEHGKDVSLGFYASVNPDCTSRGYASAAVTNPPQGGRVLSTHASDFATFVATNPRSACNRRRLQGTKVWYRASPSFIGTDSFQLQIIRANGDISLYNIQIQVR